jgi:aspartyl-tRNA(Asn)/glutamyl-tRNA(Gln) amidotransferase subunit C
MKITKAEILHVATLARLEIDAAAMEKLALQIGNILDYVDQLNQVDTAGVKPTSHALALTNAFREDAETGHLERDLCLANAPDQEDGNFLVPKVVG